VSVSPTDHVRESVIEDAMGDAAERRGWLYDKFTIPGRKGPPDRLITLRCGCMRLAELKRPKGGVVSEHQKRDHARRLLRGVKVEVPRTLDDVARIANRWRIHELKCPIVRHD
jgi:hypothetical protein